MENLPWASISYYSAFGVLVYYQRLDAQACPGHGWRKPALTALAYAGLLTGFVYLVWFGWRTAWWLPAVPLAMSALATIPAILVERVVGRPALGQFAVLAWPACAYLMFTTLHH